MRNMTGTYTKRQGSSDVLVLFYWYPFNFDQRGKLRNAEYTPNGVQAVDGSVRRTGECPDISINSSQPPATSTVAPVEEKQDTVSSPYGQIMKTLSETDVSSPAALAKTQAELKAVQSKLQATQKRRSISEADASAQTAARREAEHMATATVNKLRVVKARLKQQERLLEDSEGREAQASSDRGTLMKEVEESVVEPTKVKSQLAQAQEAVATLQSQLTVSEQEHEYTKKEVFKVKTSIAERNQQMRNILAVLTKRGAIDIQWLMGMCKQNSRESSATMKILSTKTMVSSPSKTTEHVGAPRLLSDGV